MQPEPTPKSKPYYVAIGASAGGLEAIAAFFKNMPPNSDMIFIVIQHLSPDYKSLMDELLAKVTSIPIEVVKDGTEPVPNHIYLIPPKSNMTIYNGRLLLHPQDRSGNALNLPIDVFFRSLAEDQGRNAVGIVLSGTGSDGTRGCRAIKEEGGLIMVQSEASAKFDGMPKSVIVSGFADFILAAEELPAQLMKYVSASLFTTNIEVETNDDNESQSTISKIFSMLRGRSKVDFSFYKSPTILRRLQRRISITQTRNMEGYVEYIHQNSDELTILYREMLIGVTNFFRDPSVFDHLKEKFLREYIKHSDREELRFWVAGCSTGEEAYSICILFREICEQLGLNFELKVFATDIDQDALNRASLGLYPESIAADIPHNLLSKYFVRKDKGFQISYSLREMVVFARHDLIKDPPFTNIDMVTCRNLLIYLKPETQQRIIEGFNFSLRPNGILLLGCSEALGNAEQYFDALDLKSKIFRSRGTRRSLLTSERFTSPDPAFYPRDWSATTRRPNDASIDDLRALESFVDIVTESLVPFAMIVNEHNELMRVMGDSPRFMKPLTGRMTSDISKLLASELNVPILTGLNKAFKHHTDVNFSNVRVKCGNQSQKINIQIKLLEGRRNAPLLAAVVLTESTQHSDITNKEGTYDADAGIMQRISDLEQELQFTRESLQATIEELETSNEELQATNEELLSSNEELQSTNEELQSVNEELFTVNSEYQGKICEMTELNADLENFMIATQTIVLFLDLNGTVRRFTENANQVFNIIRHDVGRPFSHISHRLQNINLLAEVQTVIDNCKTVHYEVQATDGDWYRLRIVPYTIADNKLAGTMIALQEINQIVNLREACRDCEHGKELHAALAPAIIPIAKQP